MKNGMVKNQCYNLKLNLQLKRNYIFYSDRFYSGIDISYYKQPGVITTTNEFYINLMCEKLPEYYKHLCLGVNTKSEMEDAIEDLFTLFHIKKI